MAAASGGAVGRGARGAPLIGACTAAVLLFLPAGCSPDAASVTTMAPAAKDPDVVEVSADQLHQLTVVSVKPHDFRLQKQAIGQIAFNEDASTLVLTPFSGRVTRVLAKAGDEVKRGDPLFEVDSPELVQAQTDLIAAIHGIDKAKSALTIAQRQAQRLDRLLADKAISVRETEQAHNDQAAAESDYKTAEGALTAARNRLRIIIGRTQDEVDRVERERIVNPLVTVNAPIDGTVVGRKVGPGQYVRSDVTDWLYSIVNLSTMWLKANVPETDIPLVHVGQDIEVRVNALPDRVFHARIAVIGATSDASTRRVVVRSEIPNPDGALKSEMFATFKISTNSAQSHPAIPVEAVIWDGAQAVVWVEEQQNAFHRRKIKIGLEQDGLVEVRSGLEPGDKVVSRGAIFIQNEWQQ